MAAGDVRTGRFSRLQADGEVAISGLSGFIAGTLRTCVIKVIGGSLCIGPTGLSASNALRVQPSGFPNDAGQVTLEPGAIAANVFLLAEGSAQFEVFAEYSA